MSEYTLFGSEMSYFSGKARAYLRWKGVCFEEIAPTPDVMKSEIIANIGWPVIPVLKTPQGRYVQDTADIIAYVEAEIPARRVMPDSAVQRLVSYLFQLFADEWLTLPAMHYRWNHNEQWIYSEFGKSALPEGTPEAQYEAGKAVGARFRGFVPMLGITEDTAPGIERAYEQFLADFSAHLDRYPFVMGARASFADFALIGPLYAHQYRDQATGAHMRRTAPAVARWVERVIAGEGRDGSLCDRDEIPDTLKPILKTALAEHLPVLEATNKQLAYWVSTAEPGTAVPRGFDAVPFTTGGVSGQMMARSFSLYRLQDALDCLKQMRPDERERAEAFLTEIGAERLLTFSLAAPLTRKNYRLVLA